MSEFQSEVDVSMAESTAGKGGPPPSEMAGALPELKLTQVFTSKEPLVIVGSYSSVISESAVVQSFGEYAVALAKNASQIVVINETGNKVSDIGNPKVMIVGWNDLKYDPSSVYPYLNIVIDSGKARSTQGKYKMLMQCPPQLQPFLRKYIEQKGTDNNSVKIPDAPWHINSESIGQVLTNAGEGFFIVSTPSSGEFIAFQTRNEQGIDLPSRNWIRFDNIDEWMGELPANIKKELDESRRIAGLRKQYEGSLAMQELKNGLVALTFENRLVIKKSGQADNEFTDMIGRIGKNVCKDPRNEGVIYYCTAENPKKIFRLDTAKDLGLWQTEAVDIPQTYKNVNGLRFDPTGNFFIFESGGEFVILSRDTLQEVKKIQGLYNIKIDNRGRITGVNSSGYLVVYDVNFQEVAQELDKRRIAKLAQGLVADLFEAETKTTIPAEADLDKFQYLAPIKTDMEGQFDTRLQAVTSLEDMSAVSEALTKLRTRLQSEGLQPAQIEFITRGIQDSIAGKQRILAAPVVAQGLTDLQGKLSGNLSIALLSEAREDLARLKSMEGFVDAVTRAKIIALEKQLGVQSSELFRRESPVIEKYGRDIVEREINRLGQITSKPDFDDWEKHTFFQQLKRLDSLINDYPPDAPPETLERLMAFTKQLRGMDREYRIKFTEEYAEVRQKGSKIMGERIGLVRVDINSFADRLRAGGFKDRIQAEAYLSSSEELGFLRSTIAELAGQNPDSARELDRALKVQIANILFEIERGGLTTIAETGQQMELFGSTLFPRWEALTKEKTQKKVDLIFIPNEISEGSGISLDKIYGDVGLAVINSRGKVEKVRLFEGWAKENMVRLSILPLIPPSYVTNAEFAEIKKAYADWNRGDKSKIRQELDQKSQVLREWRKARLGKQKSSQEEDEWKGLLSDYVNFYAKKHISILHRIDRVKKAPESEYENGKGFVEEWQNYWVRDSVTDGYLEEMAQILKMQLEQQSGILTIRGNPGAGKDVLVSMFSNRTHRSYFGTDCTKWDTAYEFSEDIVLESKDGASQTVHVPSTVLNGITTPGAIVYLNEIHALTEPAQIFLHALTDAKRRITLKTSSGKIIKALDSVVLVASMNPQAKDPIEPALRDRMVFMDVDYPPLYRKKDPSDPNPNPPIDASEALRIAREVKSLTDLTIEANMHRNEFVRMWDNYVNGIDNGASTPSKIQEFDMNVILAIVQFANKLRENFVAFKSGRSQTASRALPVSLPATGRPLRDCAYALSSIPDEQKIAGIPDAVARTLLERWFLSKIDNIEDREKIKTAMTTWTSQKRVAA